MSAATETAVELVEIGAAALMATEPRLSRMAALTASAIVLNATFPPAAVIVAEQGAQRASAGPSDPAAALRAYVDELRAGDASP